MIVDLKRFIDEEQPYWQELEAFLQKMRKQNDFSMHDAERVHYLYQRTSSDLMRMRTYAVENELQQYLEQLVAQVYAEMHGQRRVGRRFAPLTWLRFTVPTTVRRRTGSLSLALTMTLLGAILGAFFISVQPETKRVLVPFEHLQGDPSQRVAREEALAFGSLEDEVTFSAELIEHNTRLSLLIMALGFTWGIGTAFFLFYNGLVLGAVACDYVLAGETEFLLAWLLPHGSVEVPAFILAGQAGFLLASALIGRGGGEQLAQRFRESAKDAMHIVGLVAILLLWAGVLEAFLSQQHGNLVSYNLKIAFGTLQLLGLVLYLLLSGRRREVADA